MRGKKFPERTDLGRPAGPPRSSPNLTISKENADFLLAIKEKKNLRYISHAADLVISNFYKQGQQANVLLDGILQLETKHQNSVAHGQQMSSTYEELIASYRDMLEAETTMHRANLGQMATAFALLQRGYSESRAREARANWLLNWLGVQLAKIGLFRPRARDVDEQITRAILARLDAASSAFVEKTLGKNDETFEFLLSGGVPAFIRTAYPSAAHDSADASDQSET